MLPSNHYKEIEDDLVKKKEKVDKIGLHNYIAISISWLFSSAKK